MNRPISNLLIKHLEPKQDKEEWVKAYHAAAWTLEPLVRAIDELAGDGVVSLKDLTGRDALATLAYKAGERAMAEKVKKLLPGA